MSKKDEVPSGRKNWFYFSFADGLDSQMSPNYGFARNSFDETHV